MRDSQQQKSNKSILNIMNAKKNKTVEENRRHDFRYSVFPQNSVCVSSFFSVLVFLQSNNSVFSL